MKNQEETTGLFQDHPAVDDWSQFEILVGDITGDGRDDIVYKNADA